LGAVFSSPLDRNGGREILTQVYRSIYASPKGSTIRLVVWNFADPAITTALIAADKRGVNVQVVVAESVRNKQWFRIRDALSKNPKDRSFAVRCHNACRTDRYVMHAKIFLFSQAGKRKHVSMFGSTNLTKAAGNRQWNDQTTTANKGLYDFFVQTFKEYAADRTVSTGNDIYDNGRYRVVLFPVPETNPVAEALSKVKCHPPKGSGAGNRRTVVRIAIAGWFDEFGLNIARQVRRLWDTGCDLRIVTTLAGRKINRVLKQRYGHHRQGQGPGPRVLHAHEVDRGRRDLRRRPARAHAVHGLTQLERRGALVRRGVGDGARREEPGQRLHPVHRPDVPQPGGARPDRGAEAADGRPLRGREALVRALVSHARRPGPEAT
jgi:hypothetical protein